jgi:hypothetical protein
MSLSQIPITPHLIILTSTGTAVDPILTFDAATGVVTSSIVPAVMTEFLTSRLQQLFAVIPGLATNAYTPQLLTNMLTLAYAELGAGTLVFTVLNTGGTTWVVAISTTIGQKAYFALSHSIEQPFVVTTPVGTD